MRIVIQGEEVKVTVKSDRDLTTQEVIAAHQLSTGNFEALFISDETVEETSIEDTPQDIPEWVQVEFNCPVCRRRGKRTTKYGNIFTKCPSCDTALFNQFATGVAGEADKAGNYYIANERMRPRDGGLTDDEQELYDAMTGGKEE